MSEYREVVQNAIDSRLEEWKEGQKEADAFDGAILSVLIGVLVDLKKDIGLD